MSAPAWKYYGYRRSQRSQFKSQLIFWLIVVVIVIVFLPILAKAQDNPCPEFGYEASHTPFLVYPSFYSTGNQWGDLCQIVLIKEEGSPVYWMNDGFVQAFSSYTQLQGEVLHVRYRVTVDRIGGSVIHNVAELQLPYFIRPTDHIVAYVEYDWSMTQFPQFNNLELANIISSYGQVLVLPDGTAAYLAQDFANG